MRGEDDLIKHPPVIMFLAKAFQTDPRPRQEAKSLVEANYSVFVLAWDRERAFRPVEYVDGATVYSIGKVDLRRFSSVGLVLGDIIFQILILLGTVRLVSHLGQRPIIHAHDFNTLLPGCLLRMCHLSVALVYDSHELTYAIYSDFFGNAVGYIIRCVEQLCLRYVDTIITVSPPFAQYLCRSGRPTEVIYNCPRMSDIPRTSKLETRRELGLPLNAFIVSYIGSITSIFALDLLSAASCLTNNRNVQFLVVGDGPLAPKLREMARQSKARLNILSHVPHEKALRYVFASDLTWALYQSQSINARMTIAWKFFESLACGTPVLVGSDTFCASLVQHFKCGVVLNCDDANHIAEVILSVADDLDRHSQMCSGTRSAVRQMNCTWEAMSAKLVDIYRNLSGSRTTLVGGVKTGGRWRSWSMTALLIGESAFPRKPWPPSI
jgi:glycosyltransferase involved in cell wall biosynthesis